MPQASSNLSTAQLQALTSAADKLLNSFSGADAATQDSLSALRSAIGNIPGLDDVALQAQAGVRPDGSVTLQFPGVANLQGVTFIFDPAILSGGQAAVFAVEYHPSAALVSTVLGATPLSDLITTPPVIVASTGATTSLEGAAVGSGLNLLAHVDIPDSNTDPLLYALHHLDGITSADVVADLHQKWGSITGTAQRDTTLHLGQLGVELGDVSFTIDPSKFVTPSADNLAQMPNGVVISDAVTLTGYDPAQANEPPLSGAAMLTLDKTGATLSATFGAGQLAGWHPFGWSNTVVNQVAVQLNLGEHLLDGGGIDVDMAVNGVRVQAALLAADKDSGVVLTIDQPMSLTDLPSMNSLLPNGDAASPWLGLPAQLQSFFKNVPFTIVSTHNGSSATPTVVDGVSYDPLLQLVPQDTQIGQVSLKHGFGINAAVNFAGFHGQLNINSADFVHIDGSLTLDRLSFGNGALVISGTADADAQIHAAISASVSAATDPIPHIDSISGDAAIHLGSLSAQATFSEDQSTGSFSISNADLNLGVASLDLKELHVTSLTDPNPLDFSASGTGDLIIAGQKDVQGSFSMNASHMAFAADVNFGVFDWNGSLNIDPITHTMAGSGSATLLGTALGNTSLSITSTGIHASLDLGPFDWSGDLAWNGSSNDSSLSGSGSGSFFGNSFSNAALSVTSTGGLVMTGKIPVAPGISLNGSLHWDAASHSFDGSGAVSFGGYSLAQASIAVDSNDSVHVSGELGLNVAQLGHINADISLSYDGGSHSGDVNAQLDVSGIGHVSVDVGLNQSIESAITHQIEDQMAPWAAQVFDSSGQAIANAYQYTEATLETAMNTLFNGIDSATHEVENILGISRKNSNTPLNFFNTDPNDSGYTIGHPTTGGDGGNNIFEGSGNDTVISGSGNDVIDGGAGNDIISAGGGDDYLNGGDGNDTLLGQDGNDHIYGGAGDDLLDGGTGLNQLYGGDGNDTLQSSGGTATMAGGSGDDTYIVDSGADVVIENPNEGNDTIRAGVNYTLPDNVENLVMTGSGNLQGTGNNQGSHLTGNGHSDTLNGGSGNDTLSDGGGAAVLNGGDGNDTYYVSNSHTIVTAGSGNNTVYTSVGNNQTIFIEYDVPVNVQNVVFTGTANLILENNNHNASAYLTGNSGTNSLAGGNGNDTLDGGGASHYDPNNPSGTMDTLVGGLGDDTYIVNNLGVQIIEGANAGTDTVKASISYTLPDNVENLILTGSAAITGAGNALNNIITGNAANNTLSGGGGNDTIIGGGGTDTVTFSGKLADYHFSWDDTSHMLSVADLRAGHPDGTELLSNITMLQFQDGAWTAASLGAKGFYGSDAADLFIGSAAAEVIFGQGGNDTINGNGGADTLYGGTGDDTYIVNNTGVTIVENPGEGIDTVQSSVSHTLAANVENLTLTGNAAINGTGNELDNILTGNTAANVLTGGAGNDTLDGGGGADTLIGGAGNDTYIVRDSHVQVVEQPGEGIDTIITSVSNVNVGQPLATYAMPANVENLVLASDFAGLVAQGNDLDNIITGNANANALSGGAGNDTLDGGSGGADTLAGGTGDDTYIVSHGGMTIIENAGEGTDTVRSSISYTLGANLENLVLTGTGAINGTGNALDNVLIGNDSNNILSGGGGNDRIDGGAGDDTVVFTGRFKDYSFAWDPVARLLTVTDNRDGHPDGVETISNVEHFLFANRLTKSAADLGATTYQGTAGADLMTGTLLDEHINGMAGDDTLSGGGGADTLAGGTGNDTYLVSDTRVVVVENPGEGVDTVISSVSYTLPANVENLTLTGSSAINGTGNTLDNVLIGNDANNVLDGGGGADTLAGGTGDDTYIVNDARVIVQEQPGGGTDTVQASVSYALPDNVENLTLTGTASINGAGNALANVLTGNAGNNLLSGGDGNDTLVSSMGNDTLTGGAGNDVFEFSLGVPGAPGVGAGSHTLITDFSVGDLLHVAGANFNARAFATALSSGLNSHIVVSQSGGNTLLQIGSISSNFTVQLSGLITANHFAASGQDISLVNQAPQGHATAVLAAGVEEAPYQISAASLLQGFSDADGDSLSVTGLSADHGKLTGNGNGSWTFTPDALYHGKVTLGYQVVDAYGGAAAGSASFTLAAIHHAPTGQPSAVLADDPYGTAYALSAAQLLAGFSDVDGDPLQVSGLTASHGSVAVNATGGWIYTPDHGYQGPVQLHYSADNGYGGTLAASQSFNILPDTHQPTGQASAVLSAGQEDTPYVLTLAQLTQGFSNQAGDVLAVGGLSASHGAIADNGNGSWTFTPEANYNGSVSFNYQVLGANGDALAATQNLQLAAVNDPAVMDSAVVTVLETGAPVSIGGHLNISDIDSPATFAAQPSTAGKYGIFSIDSQGNWSYQANPAYTHLSAGATLTDSFQAWSADDTATSVVVTLEGGPQATLHLGDAPTRQSGSGGQWAQAWSQPGVTISHKADASNSAEAWSAVTLSGVSAQTLGGGDISAGDLGVSGRSAATTTIAQEIDGSEALRISLPNAAQSVTLKLANLYLNDDGTGFSESGLLRLIGADGQEVGEQAFVADAANGSKTVTASAASAFTAIELVAGAYDSQGVFHYGAYSKAGGGMGSAIYTDSHGQMHGSDFLLASADFTISLVGTQPTLP